MQSVKTRMGNDRERISRSAFIVTLSFLLSFGAVIAFLSQYPYTHNFYFDPYAILSFLPLTVNLWIIILIMRLRGRSEESVWFVLYLCGLSVACLGEGLQRLSVQPEAALFWFHLNSIGFAIMPLAYYLFVFAYVRPLRAQSPLLISSLLIGAAVMIFFFSSTGLFFADTPRQLERMSWGYNAPTAAAFPILLVWIEMLMVVALLTLVRFYRRANSDLLRRQSRVYIWAILIPLVGGSFTDGILPAVGIDSVVPVSLFLSTVTSVIAYYGLRRYRLFQINPAEFAGNVIRAMHEAVIVTDTRYRIDFMNREAERLVGAAITEVSGRDISELFTSESWQVIQRYHQGDAASAGNLDVNELNVVKQSGERVPVSVYTSRLDEDSPNEAYIFIVADISDITSSYHQLEASAARIKVQNAQLQENQETMKQLLAEAKDLQEQLKQEKENVEHTVEVRTAQLREARDKLKASDQLKSEFIMLSSHNLRTPLAIMRSSVEMLAGAGSQNLSSEQKTMVGALESSTERLAEFVEDLLTIATLEAGDGINLVPTTLKEIIEPLLKEAQTMAAAKGLEFRQDLAMNGVMIEANSMRLRGAIRNILHNALNYTDKGEIGLKIYADDRAVHIEVSDTGMGIAPDELPNIFTKFHRGTSTLQYDYQGIGIGLYLSKLVLEEHHGSIRATSELHKGSTFVMNIPRFRAVQKATEYVAAARR